jgi:hypothetical protein
MPQGRSVLRAIKVWSWQGQPFPVSGLLEIHDQDFCSLLHTQFLATDQEARVRFPALQKKKSSGFGTGSTQPRE